MSIASPGSPRAFHHRAWLFWAVLLFLILAANLSPAWAITIQDEMGRTVRLDAPPKRIVSLVPSLTETVYALGLGQRLVGVTNNADWPAEAHRKPKVGSYFAPNLEKIVALSPDIVLVSKDGNPRWVADKLSAMGVVVYVTVPGRPQQLPGSIERLAKFLGASRAGQRLAANMRRQFAAVTEAIKGRPPVPALMVIGSRPLVSVGRGTINHYLIEMAGGRNIAASARGRWPRLNKEFIVQAKPRVIILSTMERGQDLAQQVAWWRHLPALATNPGYRVAVVRSDLVDRPGPRLGQGLMSLARALHPSVFGPPRPAGDAGKPSP